MVLTIAIEVGDMSVFESWKQPIQLSRLVDNLYHGGQSRINYRATAAQLKPYFGIKESAKWPAEGLPRRLIHGIPFWVNPLGKIIEHTWYGKPIREGMHSRLMCECPRCPKEMSYGRLHQHMRVHHDE
jgi:hypothetical protein